MARKKSNRSNKPHCEHTLNESVEKKATQDGPSRTNTDLMNPEAKGGQFFRFNELPYDVRFMIWEEALANQRILRVSLEKRETTTRNKYQRRKATKAKGKKVWKVETEEDPPATPDKPYRVVVEERYAISKLFHVCSESRLAAESFYRVKVPCTYKWGNKTQDGTFYFRPELDNIQVGISEYLSDFAFSLWQLDRRYVGLINLTLPWQPTVSKIMEMDDHEIDVLRDILLRLQNVSFAHMQEKPRAAPRPVRTLAYVHSMQLANANANATNNNEDPRPPKPRTGWESDCTGPISTCIPSFESLSVDPRELGNDHTRPYFSFKNPIHIALSWFRLLESLQVVYEHKVNYRFMLSYETTGRNIATRDQAASWVQSQRKNFKARAVSEGLEHGECVQPAMGFWLYPIECVGSLVDNEGVLKTAKDVLEGMELENIMNKGAPELCLSRLV